MEFDFKELVARAHLDYVSPPFPLWWGRNKTAFVFPSLKNISRELLLNGTYFQTLTLAFQGEEFVFPNEPLISLRLNKTIVETATVGRYRRGTVKEYICTEDYQLTIRGVCVNEDPEEREEYPAEQVQMLHRMFEINQSLDVVGNLFLDQFDIKRLVLKSIELDEMAGQQGLQKYTITAVSDQDFYADLSEKAQVINAIQQMNLINIL